VASTAFVPPDLPALSAKANVHGEVGIFAFFSYLAVLSVILSSLSTNGLGRQTRSAAVSSNLDAPQHFR